ncbi:MULTISPECIES: lipopolysaccharide biosynthesis protein [Vibrio]|uniref:lipopolysaccharide biosynthesis protein n=1 Tax=Vibrio TaxID=662 RepID=UPI00079690F3|nr:MULTISPECIES: oligosaccharide flippase family protein [Vibrio]KXZ34815.1 hypothetical protein A0H77_20855 [Vibrio alginolyticus]MBT0044279.1 oligosaccharide flippase family protein [Vibrio alginolyticus]URQ94068.1 oligosaccharide flippase family protein [Vibrio sp. SCSIO 43097]
MFYFLIVDLFYKISGFLITPVLANYLGATDFGILSAILAITNILIIVIGSSGNSLVSIKYVKNGREEANKSLVELLCSGILISTVFYASSLIFLEISIDYFSWAVLGITYSLFSAFCLQNIALYRCDRKYKLPICSLLISMIIQQLGTYLLFKYYDATIDIRLILMSLSVVVQFFLLSSKNIRLSSISNTLPYLKSATLENLKYGSSLFVHHGMYWLRGLFDRVIVINIYGPQIGGVYSLSIIMASITFVGWSAISQISQPFLYEKIKNRGKNEFFLILVRFSPLFFVLNFTYVGIAYVLWGELFGDEFSQSRDYFVVLALGTTFHSIYIFLSHYLFFMEKNILLSKITTTSTIVFASLIAISYFFNLGIMYFVLSVVISSFTQLILVGLAILRN